MAWASDASSFIGSFITSLSLAQEAKEKAAGAKTGDPLGQETAVRFAISELEKARSLIEPYAHSKHEVIQGSASTIMRAYELLMSKYQDSSMLLDQVYLLEHQKQGLGTESFILLKNRVSQLTVDIETGWEAVANSATSACQVIVKRSNDGTVSRLLLNGPEKEALIDQLDALFPQTATGLEPGQSKAVAAAAIIRNALYEFPATQ